MLHTISLIVARGNTIRIHACGTGVPVILLHGFPLDYRMWLQQFESLASHYMVIAPEFRGFGGSTLDGDYSLSDLADDVHQVQNHFARNQPVHMIGLSMGGYVCLEYWRKYRQELRSLCLANTKPTADDNTARQSRLAMAELALQQGTWPAVSPMVERLLGAKSRRTEVESALVQMMQSASPAAVAAAQRAMADRADFTELLPQFRVPTLVITGELDPIAPVETTRDWAGMIPQSQLAVIDGVGHMTTMEAAEKFNAIVLDFLSRH